MKVIIIVKSCGECPYKKDNDGMGHGGSFVKCEKFNIMLRDEDGPEHFDLSKIHPKCKFPKRY